MITIYHNPRCRKSRETLGIIKEKGLAIEVKEYLNTPLSKEELKRAIMLLGMKPGQLIRKGEADFEENFKGKSLSDDEWIDAMIAYPRLMERPIVIRGDKAVLGRPPENVYDII